MAETKKMAPGFGRCMKCKKAVKIENGSETLMGKKKNIKMLKGKCGTCGTTVCRILGRA